MSDSEEDLHRITLTDLTNPEQQAMITVPLQDYERLVRQHANMILEIERFKESMSDAGFEWLNASFLKCSKCLTSRTLPLCPVCYSEQ